MVTSAKPCDARVGARAAAHDAEDGALAESIGRGQVDEPDPVLGGGASDLTVSLLGAAGDVVDRLLEAELLGGLQRLGVRGDLLRGAGGVSGVRQLVGLGVDLAAQVLVRRLEARDLRGGRIAEVGELGAEVADLTVLGVLHLRLGGALRGDLTLELGDARGLGGEAALQRGVGRLREGQRRLEGVAIHVREGDEVVEGRLGRGDVEGRRGIGGEAEDRRARGGSAFSRSGARRRPLHLARSARILLGLRGASRLMSEAPVMTRRTKATMSRTALRRA